MYLRLAAAHPVACHDTPVANYRLYDNSMSTDFDRMLRGGLTMLEHFRPAGGADAALASTWRLGRARFVGRNFRKALLAGLRDLGRGSVRPMLRASRVVAQYWWYLLPWVRPQFAVATTRQVLRQPQPQANG